MCSKNWGRDVAWAAGLFEGEGCFTYTADGRARAMVSMTDEDVIRRFHSVIGFGAIGKPWYEQGHKPIWQWKIGTHEEFQAVVAMLWSFLGERRKAKAREIMCIIRPHLQPRRGGRFCKRGHDDWQIDNRGWRRCLTCHRNSSRECTRRARREAKLKQYAQQGGLEWSR